MRANRQSAYAHFIGDLLPLILESLGPVMDEESPELGVQYRALLPRIIETLQKGARLYDQLDHT